MARATGEVLCQSKAMDPFFIPWRTPMTIIPIIHGVRDLQNKLFPLSVVWHEFFSTENHVEFVPGVQRQKKEPPEPAITPEAAISQAAHLETK